MVTMTTNYGNMVLQLFPADAPQTVNSFVFLIREGFYDDTIFHRVIPDFVVQGGDPTGTGTGSAGYLLPDEISTRQHIAGTLSMANAGPNTNGSQFFICYGSQPSLDGHYSVFGQLIEGTDVLNKIKQGDKLIKVTVEEK
jgi:peptidyl-prolyl cis-trans isomerase B (cyclophilin B)